MAPAGTPLYKIVSEHLEGWLENRVVAEHPVSAHIERELRSYLTCGILCFGFGRARCASCGQGFVALTTIFIEVIERLLCTAAASTRDGDRPCPARPRLGAVSLLHRFGSALNHHVHLHACVTDGVFLPAADHAGCDAPPTFLPARPITPYDLTALTERVRRRVIRWFRLTRLLDAAAAADMLAWENSGFSVDASVRITLLDRDVPSYFQSLEHLLRSFARPPFALGPACGGDIRLIAFITEPGTIRKILAHLGEPLEPPPVSDARSPQSRQVARLGETLR